ncbi:MAG TPA: ABC transporter ATP-binding protein, partial [Rhodocyclaceae bacterium]|nr:ABC transporter ATP-binding protein [Rhodocyclaceae bacterium]
AAERQARLAARRPLVKERDALERKLAAWQAERRQIEARLADPALYAGATDAALLQELHRRQAELAAQIDEAELRWLEIEEALEALAVE